MGDKYGIFSDKAIEGTSGISYDRAWGKGYQNPRKSTPETPEFDPQLGVNLALHAAILFFFLIILLKILILPAYKKNVNKILGENIKDLVKKGLEKMKEFSSKMGKEGISDETLKKFAASLEEEGSQDDEDQKKHNDLLNKKMYILLGAFVLGFLILFWAYRDKIDVKKLLLTNILVFIFVAILEYILYEKIIFRYIPISSTYASEQVVDALKEEINSRMLNRQ